MTKGSKVLIPTTLILLMILRFVSSENVRTTVGTFYVLYSVSVKLVLQPALAVVLLLFLIAPIWHITGPRITTSMSSCWLRVRQERHGLLFQTGHGHSSLNVAVRYYIFPKDFLMQRWTSCVCETLYWCCQSICNIAQKITWIRLISD